MDVGTIALPAPVALTSPEVSDRTVTLSWTSTDDPGFREYKIYRAISSGLDESTGELRHVETSRDATTYVDGAGWEDQPISPGTPVRPDSHYYYRVFVLDEFGLLGGSNVVGARTRRYPTAAFEVEYDLVQVDQFAGEGEIAGLAFDGSCIWIAYLEAPGGYWDDKTVRLVCRDVSTGETTREYEYTDDFRVPRGLTWDGTYLWIQYDNEGSTIRAIDPADGSEVRRFGILSDAWDLAWDGENIVIAYRQNRLEFVDPGNGGVVKQFDVPFPTHFMTSVAYRDGEIWLLENATNHAIVLAPDGRHIGIADVNVLPGDWRSGETSLAFVNDELAVAEAGRVYLLEPVPR
jgi:hypothetical protein